MGAFYSFFKKRAYICTAVPPDASRNCDSSNAQMAESVDALVSNTSGVKPVPVRDRLWVLRMSCKSLIYKTFFFWGVKKGVNVFLSAFVAIISLGLLSSLFALTDIISFNFILKSI